MEYDVWEYPWSVFSGCFIAGFIFIWARIASVLAVPNDYYSGDKIPVKNIVLLYVTGTVAIIGLAFLIVYLFEKETFESNINLYYQKVLSAFITLVIPSLIGFMNGIKDPDWKSKKT